MKDYDLSQIEVSAGGLDDFLQREPSLISPFGAKKAAPMPKPMRQKIGSLQQLDGFVRASADTLVHKSTRDLWALRKNGEEFYIERLFQDGEPLKG